MTQPALTSVIPARWDSLRRFTDARIALGRAGHSLPTSAHLNFQLAHAQARDAVHLPFDALGIAESMRCMGLQALLLHSAATDRATYLQRPDLGRKLDERSRQTLAQWRSGQSETKRFDLAFVIADGLSALAIHRNAAELIAATLARLRVDDSQAWSVAPVAVIEQGRVAVGDEIGHALQANVVAVLIGERPGLSSPDSLGIYLTWAPKPGLTDASRNCISNVRPAGLSVPAAAAKLHQLLSQSRIHQLTGVGLKDEADDQSLSIDSTQSGNFLLGN
jgi:ethanolamine ammonia-lyase small subunit